MRPTVSDSIFLVLLLIQSPAGFYDTAEEKELAKKQALDPTFEALRVDKLEAKRRDEEEARERAKDKKRQKKIMEENLPQVRKRRRRKRKLGNHPV